MQSEIADPYRILGISRTADAEELKRAYRKLSLVWHPDRHATAAEATRSEAERRFKLINAAYLEVGETIRVKAAQQSAPEERDGSERSRIMAEAIRSVVASTALRVIPNLPRHTYRRVVDLVEGLLLDTVALGERAFINGFDAAVREGRALVGLGPDVQQDIIRVLEAAADELQWRGKGVDTETWKSVLRPVERALRPQDFEPAQPRPTSTAYDLLRPEPLMLGIQVLLVLLLPIMLLPSLALGGTARVLAIVAILIVLGYITLGPRRV